MAIRHSLSGLLRYSLVALVLLLIFVTRLRWHSLEMHGDELWSLWNSSGTPSQTIQWTPFDWNPFYFLLLNLWRSLTGDTLFVARLLSLLVSLVSGAVIFAIMRRFGNWGAALLALIAYGALGYYSYIALEIRAYSLLVTLLLLVIWLTLRYFDQPTMRRAVPLALAITACFAIQATVLVALVLVGILTLTLYGRQVWRWAMPIAMALPISLLVIGQGGETLKRLQRYNPIALMPLDAYIADLFTFHTGALAFVWAVVMVLAMIGMARAGRGRAVMAWGLWVLAGVVLFYGLLPVFNTGVSRHSWWLPIGLVMLVGWGLAHLPRLLRLASGIVLAGMMFAPLTVDRYYHQPYPNPPLGEQMAQLAQQARWGDVVVLDARQACSPSPAEWDYFSAQYFSQGLPIVEGSVTARRVWFVTSNGWQDTALEAGLQHGRLRSTFFGPPQCLFQLYEAPPDAAGVPYDNGLRFQGVEQLVAGQVVPPRPIVLHEGETLSLRVWWSTDRPLPQDYSMSVVFKDNTTDAILLQQDGAPQLTQLFANDTSPLPDATSRWQPQQLYIQQVEIPLPAQVTPYADGSSTYTVCIAVYYWETLERVAFAGASDERCLPLASFSVMSW